MKIQVVMSACLDPGWNPAWGPANKYNAICYGTFG